MKKTSKLNTSTSTSKLSKLNTSTSTSKLSKLSKLSKIHKNKILPNKHLFKLYKEDITIANYIDNLYKFIKNIKICFLSGAFVIEDKNQRLWRLLRFTDKKNISKFIGLTHNIFKPTGHQYDRYILDIDEIKRRRDDPNYKDDKCKCLKQFPKQYQMVCINCNKKTPEGIFIKQCKGIIKFYKFRYNNIVHVFLKLEKWRTIKQNEIIKHFKEYKNKIELKKKNIKRTLGNERVEDCENKCKNHYINDYHNSKGIPLKICIDNNNKTRTNKFINLFKLKKSKKNNNFINNCKTVKDWENRKGDEVFIPNFINEALLNNIIPYVKK